MNIVNRTEPQPWVGGGGSLRDQAYAYHVAKQDNQILIKVPVADPYKGKFVSTSIVKNDTHPSTVTNIATQGQGL